MNSLHTLVFFPNLQEADAQLVDGADEYLQLLAIGGKMIKAIG